MSNQNEALAAALVIDVKEVSPVSKTADIRVPAEQVSKTFASVLKEAASQIQLGGFRRGKAPLAIIKARFGAQFGEEVEKDFQRAIFEKVQKDYKVVSVTDYKAKDDAKPVDGKDFECTIAFETAPEIKLPDYAKYSIEVPAQKTVEEEVAVQKEYFKNIYSDYETVQAPAVDGDMLKVDYTSDFTPAEDAPASLKRLAAAQDSWVWLSTTGFVPGATEALTGAKAGDVKSFTADFPADWREPGLAGKKVAYTFTVKEVQHKNPITDDKVLAEKLKLETVEKMDEMLKKQADAKLTEEKKQNVRDAVLNKLAEDTPDFEFPKSMISRETNATFSAMAREMVRSEADAEKFKAEKDAHAAEAEKKAKDTLKRKMILSAIAEKENITLDGAELEANIDNAAAYYRMSKKEFMKRIQENNSFEELYRSIQADKALEVIAGKVEVKVKA